MTDVVVVPLGTIDPAKVRELRAAKGMSMDTAACRAGLYSGSTWARVESGQRIDPRLSTAFKIATALGVRLDAILVKGKRA